MTSNRTSYIGRSRAAQNALVHDDPNQLAQIRFPKSMSKIAGLISCNTGRCLSIFLRSKINRRNSNPSSATKYFDSKSLFNYMHLASRLGSLEALVVLIQHFKIVFPDEKIDTVLFIKNLQSKNKYNETSILEAAVINNRVEVVSYLFTNYYFNEKLYKTSSLLTLLKFEDNPDMVELLVKNGANPNARSAAFNQIESVLEYAVYFNRVETLKRLKSDQLKEYMEPLSNEQKSRLFKIAYKLGYGEILQLLKEMYDVPIPREPKKIGFKKRVAKNVIGGLLLSTALLMILGASAPVLGTLIYVLLLEAGRFTMSIYCLELEEVEPSFVKSVFDEIAVSIISLTFCGMSFGAAAAISPYSGFAFLAFLPMCLIITGFLCGDIATVKNVRNQDKIDSYHCMVNNNRWIKPPETNDAAPKKERLFQKINDVIIKLRCASENERLISNVNPLLETPPPPYYPNTLDDFQLNKPAAHQSNTGSPPAYVTDNESDTAHQSEPRTGLECSSASNSWESSAMSYS